ncbi:MAG: transposase [Alcaligenaceae bacterium]|nr:MAG: transposase [Alcaligenaceae bacterium]
MYRKTNPSRKHPQHRIYPYLLRGLPTERKPGVGHGSGLSPESRGFLHLAAVMDWHSRKVLAWEVLTSMEAEFYVRVLDYVLARDGKPAIFDTDQGS